MQNLKDKVLVTLAGFIAVLLIVVSSGVIPGAFASPTEPALENSDPTTATGSEEISATPVQGVEAADSIGVSTAQADTDATPFEPPATPSRRGVAAVRASFTVGDPR